MSYPPSHVSGVETESVRDVHHAMLAIIIRVGNSGARAATAAASITSSAAPPLKSEAFTQLPATLKSALYLFLPLFPSLGPSLPTSQQHVLRCAAMLGSTTETATKGKYRDGLTKRATETRHEI